MKEVKVQVSWIKGLIKLSEIEDEKIATHDHAKIVGYAQSAKYLLK